MTATTAQAGKPDTDLEIAASILKDPSKHRAPSGLPRVRMEAWQNRRGKIELFSYWRGKWIQPRGVWIPVFERAGCLEGQTDSKPIRHPPRAHLIMVLGAVKRVPRCARRLRALDCACAP
jgi:hypothetical protein